MTDPTRAAAFATPTAPSGDSFKNITTSDYFQIANGATVADGVSINTAGTTSAVKLYDGTSSVVTITIATPGVISWAGHPFAAGEGVVFAGGTLPTGLTAGTVYYVSTVGLTVDAFSVADTAAHALAGTNTVATSGTQSGSHSAYDVSNPIGSFSTVAQGGVALGNNGALCEDGLIAITTDGGGAANITIYHH